MQIPQVVYGVNTALPRSFYLRFALPVLWQNHYGGHSFAPILVNRLSWESFQDRPVFVYDEH
jgi:hypothetical protein